MVSNYTRKGYLISTDKRKLQSNVVHNFLTKSYWDKGIEKEEVIRKIKNSLCFGVYHDKKQIGFGRVITDYTTLAYIADVFILEKYRGRGLSKWLMKCVLKHPELKRIKNWMLKTSDAQKLYEKFGFKVVINKGEIMEMKPGRRN